MATPTPQSQTFNTSGTFTVPACIDTLTIKMNGGGGGGSGAIQDGSLSGGGGGEGGWYAERTIDVVSGWVCLVDVGTGGAAVGNGGFSRFRDPDTTVRVLASGGYGAASAAGAGGSGIPLTAMVGTIVRAGGAGGNGTQFGGGGGGSSAGTAAVGANGSDGIADTGGAGGLGPAGGGSGADGGDKDADGKSGTAPGGAGSGAGGNGTNVGGAGAAGRVIVSWIQELEVLGVAVSVAGNYAPGSQITVTVTTTQAATVSTAGGTPTVNILLGGQVRQAVYTGGSGTRHLTFGYTVTVADNGLTGLSTDVGVGLNGGTIKDGCGQDFNLDFAAVSQAGVTAGPLSGMFNFFSQGPSAFGDVRTGFNPSMLGD